MSGRAPYGPSIERFTDCVCNILPMEKIVSINEAADKCSTHHEIGIDPRTVERYVTQHPSELNKSTNKKCGKEVTEECARKGFKITESISGALRDRRKKPISARRSPRGLSNVGEEGVCFILEKSIEDSVLVQERDLNEGYSDWHQCKTSLEGELEKDDKSFITEAMVFHHSAKASHLKPYPRVSSHLDNAYSITKLPVVV